MSPEFRIKLDENLGVSHVALLARHGYDADRVYDQGLSGAGDAEVWRRVQSESRFFITLDLDFSDVRRFPPESHAGLLLLRPLSRSRNAVAQVLERVLSEHRLQDFAGSLVVADEAQTRLRRRP